MRILAAAFLALTLPAWAATPAPSCGNLCGSWELDAGRSESATTTLDTALLEYSEPRARRSRDASPSDTVGQIEADMERSLGPIHDRLGRAELRAELLPMLTAPQRLVLDGAGRDILIRGDNLPVRRLSPGVPHSRVDVAGTARIRCGWDAGNLKVSERYDSKRTFSETYLLQRADGSLLVMREVKRPGLKLLRLRAVYRRI